MIIGMLHYRKHPWDAKKAYAFAAVAKMEGVDFYYFSPGKVNFESETVLAWLYQSGKWIEQLMPFPDVICNVGAPKTSNQTKIYRKLKRRIPFTSHSIGNKMSVQRKIEKGEEYRQYLIPSKAIVSIKDVYEFLDEFKSVVVKPFSGNRGRDILFIESSNRGFNVFDQNEKWILSEAELNKWVNQKITQKKFMVQQYIQCKTSEGLPYDFRLHVQKNGEGIWEKTLIYPRIGSDKGIVSNIHHGGYRGELIPFLKKEFGEAYFEIAQYLEQFALKFSTHFDRLYKKPLDELGIDIGLDENRKIRIFEVNWRPGSRHRELEVAKRMIPYAVYLAKNYKN